MRNSANRLKVERLFVLGAGASHAASRDGHPSTHSPLDLQFCQRITSLDYKRPKWVNAARGSLVRHWLDPKTFETCGLEQAILRQLGHTEFVEAIHRRRRRNRISGFEYVDLMAHVICFVLSKCREGPAGAYQVLANSVFPREVNSKNAVDRIITFNYDTLFDDHLLGRIKPQRLYFDKIRSDEDQAPRVSFPHPLLLKLHGSINWRMTTADLRQIIEALPTNDGTLRYIDKIWVERTLVPSPADAHSPCIIPPLPVKPISTISLFQFLWTKALEYLSEARELYICGYSLPDADRMAVSLFSSFRNSRLERITIVDTNAAMLGKWRAVLHRKGVRGARWEYFDDFSDFALQVVKGAAGGPPIP